MKFIRSSGIKAILIIFNFLELLFDSPRVFSVIVGAENWMMTLKILGDLIYLTVCVRSHFRSLSKTTYVHKV